MASTPCTDYQRIRLDFSVAFVCNVRFFSSIPAKQIGSDCSQATGCCFCSEYVENSLCQDGVCQCASGFYRNQLGTNCTRRTFPMLLCITIYTSYYNSANLCPSVFPSFCLSVCLSISGFARKPFARFASNSANVLLLTPEMYSMI